MTPDSAFLTVTVVGLLLAGVWHLRSRSRKKGLPYRSRGCLLSKGEAAFFRVLVQAVPPGVRVCPKVRLADLVSWPRNGWREFGAPTSGKHVDFVLVEGDSARILTCVELDDKSHDRRDRRQRDAFVNATLRAAGIPVVHVRAAAGYNVQEIRKLVTRC